MVWPQATDYGEAIQNLAVNFRDPELIAGQAVVDAMGLPVPRTGNFASVFEVRHAAAAQRWAVKCFTKHAPGLQERYHHIDAHLREQQEHLPFMVGFNYLPEGVLVQGRWYAVLKMDWVDGLRLDEFLAECLPKRNYKSVLRTLCEMWMRLAEFLRVADVAHGDLQHGNVILVPVSEQNRALDLKLIDYDGMYVPKLAEIPPGEVGHPAYQHPERLATGAYGPDSDRFSQLLIYCTLRCLIAGGPALWDQHYDGDRLLIGRQDLACPEHSAVFRDLWRLPDPAAQALVGHLLWATKSPLDEVPLLPRVVVNSKIVPLAEERRRQIDQWMSGPAARRASQTLRPAAEPLPAARRLTGTDDGWVSSAPVAAVQRRTGGACGPEAGREQRLLEWIKAGTLPSDLYQLLGRPRFDCGREALLRAIQDCTRALHRLQNLPGELAKRVQQMQLQTAEAQSVFSDDTRWQEYDERLVAQWGDQYAAKCGRDATRWRRDDLRRWLAARDVLEERLDDLVCRLLAGRETQLPSPAPPKPAPVRAEDFRSKAFHGFRRPAAETVRAAAQPAPQRPRDSSGPPPLSTLDAAGQTAVPPRPGVPRAADTPPPAGLGQAGDTPRVQDVGSAGPVRRRPPRLRPGGSSRAMPPGGEADPARPPAPPSLLPGLLIIGGIVGVVVVVAIVLAIAGWFFLLPLLAPDSVASSPGELSWSSVETIEFNGSDGTLMGNSPPLHSWWQGR